MFRPGNRRPIRLKDIAERCGIATSTVSCALSGTGRISAATIERVRDVAREMGYDASRHANARSLRYSGQTLSYVVGLVFDNRGLSGTNYFTNVLRGVFEGIEDGEFELLTSDSQAIGARGILPTVYRKGDIDGVLALATSGDLNWQVVYHNLRSDVAFDGRPIVGLVERMDGCSSVCADHFDSGYLAMSHLLDLAHRRILLTEDYVLGDSSRAGLRSAGYSKSCRERGLDVEQCLVPTNWSWTSDWLEERQRDMARLTSEAPPITAIIAHNDKVAGYVYAALVRSGLRVPEDISLISYDNTDPIYSPRRDNILTSVNTPLFEIGKEAVRLLIGRITGEEAKDRDIILPVRLVVRNSTAHRKSSKH